MHIDLNNPGQIDGLSTINNTLGDEQETNSPEDLAMFSKGNSGDPKQPSRVQNQKSLGS